jgi:hypothetical protein
VAGRLDWITLPQHGIGRYRRGQELRTVTVLTAGPPKARAIRYLVNNWCEELRPIAEEITNGFGIPPEVLAAPIAQ